MRPIVPAAVTAGVAVLATVVAGCSSSSSGPGSGASTPASTSASSATSPSTQSSTASTTAGGGSSSSDPNALAQQALHAITTARTFEVKAAPTSSDVSALDVHYGATSTQASLTSQGNHIQIIQIGDTVYFKAPLSLFLQKLPASQRSQVAAVLRGKWIKEPASSPEVAQFKDLTDRATFVKGITATKTTPNFTAAGSKTVNGVATTELKDAANGLTLFVASSGTPFPMEVDKTGGSDGGSITFDAWNQPFTAQAPPASDVVDASQLGG